LHIVAILRECIGMSMNVSMSASMNAREYYKQTNQMSAIAWLATFHFRFRFILPSVYRFYISFFRLILILARANALILGQDLLLSACIKSMKY